MAGRTVLDRLNADHGLGFERRAALIAVEVAPDAVEESRWERGFAVGAALIFDF